MKRLAALAKYRKDRTEAFAKYYLQSSFPMDTLLGGALLFGPFHFRNSFYPGVRG